MAMWVGASAFLLFAARIFSITERKVGRWNYADGSQLVCVARGIIIFMTALATDLCNARMKSALVRIRSLFAPLIHAILTLI